MKEKRIDSHQNAYIKHLVKLQKSRDYRRENRLAVVEGIKMCREASTKKHLKTILIEESLPLPESLTANEIIRVPFGIIEKIAEGQNPEGILAEVNLPEFKLPVSWKRILVLDRIKDPGNMGQLLRTAAAFGWDGVCLVEECCDPFNPKAIAAARGSTFNLPIVEMNWPAFKEQVNAAKGIVVSASLTGIPFLEFSPPPALALVLGNEAEGVSKEILTQSLCLTIPMKVSTESLNVAAAGAILLHHFQRSVS